MRYRTGDLTVRITTPSVFGRTICLPLVVFGRTDEMVKIKGVKLYPSEIRSVLLGIDGLDGKYRIILSKKPGGGDAIRLTLSGTGGGDVIDRVAHRFKSRILVGADDIDIVEVLDGGPAIIDERGS